MVRAISIGRAQEGGTRDPCHRVRRICRRNARQPGLFCDQMIAPNIAAAVADPARPEADRARDENRKPAECLGFAGVKAGDRVGELVPGGGYFTRLLSKAVGPKGYVYAYMPSDIDEMYKKHGIPVPPPADPNYPNVSYIHAPIAKFVTPEKLDLVWTSQNYHDLHDKIFGPADVPAVNKAIYDALKPGGIFLISTTLRKRDRACATPTRCTASTKPR